jgi:D-xylono/L-arabinono-1,4-lactonase
VQRWKDGRAETVVEEIPEETDSRFNDVIADPRGRVFCGTMPAGHRKGRLYRLDLDGSLRVVVEEVGLPNGMAFSEDAKAFFFTDSRAKTIWRFDYDEQTGEIRNRRDFARIDEGEDVVPDGLVMDAEGFLWSARYGGGAIVRHAPDGSVDRRIEFPTPKITSLTFGHEHRDMAYVTSASGEDAGDEAAGALFQVDLGVRGRAEFLSAVGRA